MKTTTEKIREAIQLVGGIYKFSSADRKNRPMGCPMKKMMKDSLQELENEEIHIAFKMGLIGNNNRKGTIVENSKK